eukprot:305052_1
MWCNHHHEKIQPYHVAKPHRHISLYWNLKKWIQKFSLKQQTLNEIKQFVKDIKLQLESCPSSTIHISNKNTFLNQPTNELSPKEHIPFHFEPPKRIDLIGSFLFYGICFNANYAHTDHFNVDISVTMPSPTSITLKDITANNKHYLLKRRAYLHMLYQHLKANTIPMISPNQNTPCAISIDYLNHDPLKPILVIKATAHCYIRIIPSVNIKQFTATSDTQQDLMNSDDEEDVNSDDDLDEELDEDMIMERIFFGSFYKKYRILKEQYGTDLTKWSYTKLSQHLHPEDMSKAQLMEHYLFGQQIMEDVFMRSTFFDFYSACKVNPNLHRALVLIKAWWNNTNFHVQKGSNSSDSTRFGDMNSFHLTMLLLLFYRSYHFDKWDSPLVVMAKFLELVSREELGTLLCQTPPSSLFERNPNWYTSFGDSHLFTSLTSNIDHNRDRASIFDPKRMDFKEKDSAANANIYTTDNEDGDAVSNVYYSYNIWKTKKKGIAMSMPNDTDEGMLDEWIDGDKDTKEVLMKILCGAPFPVVFGNVSGRMNYTFRVNRCNYLHLIKEARKASFALNALLMEIPFMPNPEYWAYSKQINPAHYDIVKAPVMTFHQKCVEQLLIPQNMQFFMYFDGFVKLNVESLLGTSAISVVNHLEHIVLNALSDRCRSFVFYYDPICTKNQLFIGLTMHTFCFREMILGPPKDEKFAVRKFCEFWGKDCVEMKRFADGTLLHTVTLSATLHFESYLALIDEAAAQCHMNKQKQREMELKKKKKKFELKRAPSYVIDVILYHTLSTHLGLKTDDIELTLDPFWSITPSCLAHSARIGAKTDEMRLDRAYQKLERTLKSICNNKRRYGVPLRLNEMISIDPHLWNIAIATPKQKNIDYTSYSLIDNLRAIHVDLKFEASAVWPKSNLSAVNHLKLAFYIQMHRALGNRGVHSLLSKEYLDVIMNGFNFRCFIVADTEFEVHKFESARIARYQFKFVPKLGHVLRGISRNYAYFSPTVSLVKRWFHCNLFSDLMDEHLLTVLVADLFVNCSPYPAPQSALIALTRFLYLLSHFAWIDTPYIVDLGVPNPSMVSASVSSAGLDDTSRWTKQSPTLKTLDRLVTTARTSLQYLFSQMQTTAHVDDDEFLRVFRASKTEFDFVINLKTRSVPHYEEHLWKTQKGMNQWREEQIMKRMMKMQIKQEEEEEEEAPAAITAVRDDGVMPFIRNPVWEQKKRKFEELQTVDDAPPSKKRKLLQNKFTQMIEDAPQQFLEENSLFVIGLNPVTLFANAIHKLTNQQMEIYYDKCGATFIGCKWTIKANKNTQKTLFNAIWEVGKDLVKSIKIMRCPQDNHETHQELQQMLNVMHVKPAAAADDTDADGWTVVDSKHNI